MLARQHLYPARVVQFPAGYAFSLSTFHAELQVGNVVVGATPMKRSRVKQIRIGNKI